MCWPSFGAAPQIAVSLSRKKRAYGFERLNARIVSICGICRSPVRHRRLDQRDGFSGVEIGSNINGVVLGDANSSRALNRRTPFRCSTALQDVSSAWRELQPMLKRSPTICSLFAHNASARAESSA